MKSLTGFANLKRTLLHGMARLKMRVDEMTPKIGIDRKCSSSWLQRFKEKWNIIWQTVSTEGVSSNIDSAEKWHKHVKPIST
jgi:hypothetical protein